MTLCIGWKTNDRICFASDSRVSNNNDDYVDIGIKVMSVPVKINGPRNSISNSEPCLYNYHLGLCYAGDSTTAYLIKETITEVLTNLQIPLESENFTFQGICKVVSLFFENTAQQLKDGLNWDPDVEFLLGGYCPKEKNITVYKFEFINPLSEKLESIFDRVLEENNEYVLLGSGSERAEELIEDKATYSDNDYMESIRQICMDDEIESVGGYLQFGDFRNNNFKVFGVEGYEYDDQNNVNYIHPLRGTILYQEEFSYQNLGFHIAYDFVRPFQKDIDDHLNNLL